MPVEIDLEYFYTLLREVHDRTMLREVERYPDGLMKDLTFHEIHVIENIGDNLGVTMGHLAKLSNVKTSSMTAMIDKLVRRGLVTRRRKSTDRRVVTAALTAKGKRAYEEHRQIHDIVGREIISLLSDEEREVVMSLYSKITQWAEKQEA